MKARFLTPVLAAFALCTGMIFFRMLATGTTHLLFLGWNMFLAILPLVFAYGATRTHSHLLKWGYSLLWLLFFPNSLYIVTDFIHLNQHGYLKWYDMGLLYACSVAGLFTGFLSMYGMQRLWYSHVRHFLRWAISFGVLWLAAFGVYVGRFLRLNSWDMLTSPLASLSEIVTNATQDHWALALSTFFCCVYIVFYLFCESMMRVEELLESQGV